MTAREPRRPIILLGAARSGTKMVRALIASHPDVIAVPYDINYVWKYGNYALFHDELTARDLTPRARRYIRSFFAQWLRRSSAPRVIEKTVSNTLRISFVRAVFPDCQLVHLVRDGRDVAASARRMWQAPADWRAILTKARRFPLRAVPRYGLDYLRSYLHRSFAPERRVKSWGPRFSGIDEIAATRPLIETCAVQWRRSIETATAGLAEVDDADKLEIRYEQLVRDPRPVVAQLLEFLGLEPAAEVEGHLAAEITASNVGKWRRQINEHELEGVIAEIGGTLAALGYSE